MPIVAHPNFSASPWPRPSDHLAMYEAEQCKRQAVTVDWLFQFMAEHDLVAWHFVEECIDTDPWREITGIDAQTDFAEFYLDIAGTTRTLDVEPKDIVFVQVRDLDRIQPGWRQHVAHAAGLEVKGFYDFMAALRDGRSGHASEWLEYEPNRKFLLSLLKTEFVASKSGFHPMQTAPLKTWVELLFEDRVTVVEATLDSRYSDVDWVGRDHRPLGKVYAGWRFISK